MFKTKTHLLSEVRDACDIKKLAQFAKLVSIDSLNTAKIKTKGTTEEILESLLKAPKSVLENVFDDMFCDEDELDEGDEDELDEEE